MPYLGYTLIGIIFILILTFSVIKEPRRKWVYPLVLYFSSVSLCLLVTCAGPGLVGGDIHLDYYYALLRNGQTTWEPLVGIPQGTSILSYFTSWIWAYKVIYPMIYCTVPVILYNIYTKWLSTKKAFLASIFFIVFPTFFLEIPTIARQMVAEVFLALSYYLILKSTLRLRYKLPLLFITGASMPLFHYSIGIVALVVLGISLLVSLILKAGKKRELITCILGIIIVGGSYLSVAQEASVARKVLHLLNYYIPNEIGIKISVDPIVIPSRDPGVGNPVPSVVGNATSTKKPFIERYESLVREAIGVGFTDYSTLGKAFRIIQWVLLFILGIGLSFLIKKKEYFTIAIGSIIIVLLCLVPGWASILNLTRYVHIASFILAPALVYSIKKEWILGLLLSVYLTFTSGLVFEASSQPNIATFNLPYNPGLSDYRIDLGATFTEGDKEVREYIVENNLFPLYSDDYGTNLIGEVIGLRGDINWALPKTPRELEVQSKYLYLRSRNIEEGYVVTWWNIGLRRYWPLEDFGIDPNENIVFQSGDARVIKLGD